MIYNNIWICIYIWWYILYPLCGFPSDPSHFPTIIDWGDQHRGVVFREQFLPSVRGPKRRGFFVGTGCCRSPPYGWSKSYGWSSQKYFVIYIYIIIYIYVCFLYFRANPILIILLLGPFIPPGLSTGWAARTAIPSYPMTLPPLSVSRCVPSV